MSLSFIYPIALWALLLLPAFWLFAWATRAANLPRLGPKRYGALLALRSLILVALIAALAGAQFVRQVDDTAVVFLIDGSDSVAPAQRERALAYVNAAIAAGQPADQSAVVVFGAEAAVERAPSPLAPIGRLSSAVVASRTDIADAVQLGLALLPGDAQKRLVLLSDGGENEGRAIEAARLAALRGVPIEVVPLPTERGPDVLLAGLDLPLNAREGQELPLTVRLESGVAGPARVEIFADGELVAASEVALTVGSNELRVAVASGEAGFRRFEARVTAAADTQPLNNSAAGFTRVKGPPRVLLIASAEDRAAPLRAALDAAGLRVELLGPAQTPGDPTLLEQYAAVVLVDVPAAEMPVATQRALATYVREQGGGLAMIGGADSFGAGGWRRSPLAELLPVELDPPSKDERPDLALALVIDRSGSMAEAAGLGRSKLDLAKEAVYQATQGLLQRDQLGVFVFDDFAQATLPIQQLPDVAAIETALSGIDPGGGTNIRSGIELAGPALINVDARVKHIILLTDGIADDNYADLVSQLRDQNVTISTVAIGSDANPDLEAIAQLGGGAFYRATQIAEVPRIFLNETVRVAQRDLVEGQFTPAVALPAPPVRGLGGLPPLYGYNATTARAAARTLLVAPDGSPVLAVWQVGLGRSLAWTSDFKGQWARDWLGWETFPRFAVGLIDTLLPPPSSDQLTLEARADGASAVLDLFVSGADGRLAEAATLEGRLLDPEGQAATLRFTQVGLGRYRAVTPANTPGVYLAQVVALDPQGQPLGTASGGLVVNYSAEYGPRSAAPPLLADLAALTGGNQEPPPEQIFASLGQPAGRVVEIALPLLWLALLLLPFDIALRRLFLRASDLAPVLTRRSRPASAMDTPDAAMERLRAARARVRPPVAETLATPTPPVAPVVPPIPVAPPARVAPEPPPASARPPADTPDDDALASLLAAKARRRR